VAVVLAECRVRDKGSEEDNGRDGEAWPLTTDSESKIESLICFSNYLSVERGEGREEA